MGAALPGIRQIDSKNFMSIWAMSMWFRWIRWMKRRSRGAETQFFRDGTKTIIARNNSPDVGFETSLNPYRGCEHGCIYCFARPTHEYLGLSAGLDFESKIMVKMDAPKLLEAELSSPKWKPQVAGHERSDRSVSAGRTEAADHAGVSRGAGEISQSGGDHHQEPPGDARHRSSRRAGRSRRRRCQCFGHLARSKCATRAGAAHLIARRRAWKQSRPCARPEFPWE